MGPHKHGLVTQVDFGTQYFFVLKTGNLVVPVNEDGSIDNLVEL